MEKALISMGVEEMEALIAEQGSAELACHFCDNVQNFSREELEALLADMKESLNGK
jgi:molecular chaperone Hsp33